MPEKSNPKGPEPKICPECGEDITAVDILAHRDGHWGKTPPDPRLFPDAAKRFDALTALAEAG